MIYINHNPMGSCFYQTFFYLGNSGGDSGASSKKWAFQPDPKSGELLSKSELSKVKTFILCCREWTKISMLGATQSGCYYVLALFSIPRVASTAICHSSFISVPAYPNKPHRPPSMLFISEPKQSHHKNQDRTVQYIDTGPKTLSQKQHLQRREIQLDQCRHRACHIRQRTMSTFNKSSSLRC